MRFRGPQALADNLDHLGEDARTNRLVAAAVQHGYPEPGAAGVGLAESLHPGH